MGTNFDDIRERLRTGDVSAVFGLAESEWLAVRKNPYVIENPQGREEFLKDVAGLANNLSGGLILIGFNIDQVDGAALVSGACPLSRESVNVDHYAGILEQGLLPEIVGHAVTWIDCEDNCGVVVVDVPAQVPSRQPFVVAGRTHSGKEDQRTIAVPVRDGNRVRWLPPAEIQRILARGYAISVESGTGSLADLPESVAACRSAHQVGVGVSGWKRRFRSVYEQVRQMDCVGDPLSEVFVAGPGVVQYFASSGLSEGWALCSLEGGSPVMVAESIWEACHAVGAAASGGDPLTEVGFPVVDDTSRRLIDGCATVVTLRGGLWGDGRLVRASIDHAWVWEQWPGYR